MNTLGWVLIIFGALLVRSVYKGRVMEIGDDLSDALLSLIRGDTKGFTEVLARTGDANKADVADEALHTIRPISVEEIRANPGLAQTAMTLGKSAKGYKFGATGPDYYDCSGLVWRVVQKHGFKGGRFTTSNMLQVKDFKRISKADAHINDIVLWPGYEGLIGHTGIMTSQEEFYSARSVRSGIGVAKIAGFKSSEPVYLRYTGNGGG